MEVVYEVADLRLPGDDFCGGVHLDDELMNLDFLGFATTGGAGDEGFAEAAAGGGKGDVNVVIDGLSFGFGILRALRCCAGFIDDTDDLIVGALRSLI